MIEDSRAFRSKYLKLKSEECNSEKVQTIPIFRLSLFDIIKMEENFIPSVQLSSSLFQWINLLDVIHIISHSYYIYIFYILSTNIKIPFYSPLYKIVLYGWSN